MKPETKAALEEARGAEEYWSELALLEFTSDLARLMDENPSVTKAELARRIGCSAPHVTQVLSGNINCTVSTLVKFALALRAAVHIRVKPIEDLSRDDAASDASVAVLEDYRKARLLKAPSSYTVTSASTESASAVR